MPRRNRVDSVRLAWAWKRMRLLRERGGGVLGVVVGLVLGLIVLPRFIQAAPAPLSRTPPKYVHLIIAIVDARTGQPIEADITLRRERADGTLAEPEIFDHGHQITLEVPVDEYRTWLLVEKPGYDDWERELGPGTFTRLSGSIRLVPLNKLPTSLYPQG